MIKTKVTASNVSKMKNITIIVVIVIIINLFIHNTFYLHVKLKPVFKCEYANQLVAMCTKTNDNNSLKSDF